MEIVKVIPVTKRGGEGFNVDISDNLEDMSYAEKAILNKVVLEALVSLTTAVETTAPDRTKNIGPAIVLDKSDVPQYDGKYFAGAANKINQIFTYLERPYLVSGLSRKGQAERLQIIKTGEKYNINLYNVEGSEKTVPREREITVVENGIEVKKKEMYKPQSYHDATVGMKLRIDKWFSQNLEELGEIAGKMGYQE